MQEGRDEGYAIYDIGKKIWEIACSMKMTRVEQKVRGIARYGL